MSDVLGTILDRDGREVWSGTGRPVTDYEKRLRARCGHLWLPLFDGIYLLQIRYPDGAAFETRHDRALMSIRASFLSEADVTRIRAHLLPVHGGEWAPWRRPHPPTREQMLEIVTLAVIGGGKGVVGGETRVVTRRDAQELVSRYLADAPSADLAKLVLPILNNMIEGDEPTAEEFAAFTIERAEPVVPAWVLAA